MLYKSLLPSPAKNAVASRYQLNVKALVSWIHSLVYVRNVLAHHCRFWNKKISVSPMLLKSPKLPFTNTTTIPRWGRPYPVSYTAYYTICMLRYLLFTINPNSTFKEKLFALFAKYPNIDLESMGFPRKYLDETFWKSDYDGT